MTQIAKIFCAALLAGAALVAAIEPAAALPAAPAPGFSAADAGLVQETGWRCGPGWHVNSWGRCVPNRRPFGPRPWGPRPWRRW